MHKVGLSEIAVDILDFLKLDFIFLHPQCWWLTMQDSCILASSINCNLVLFWVTGDVETYPSYHWARHRNTPLTGCQSTAGNMHHSPTPKANI